MPRLALGRAYLQKGDFAAAIPLIEPQLAGDKDGSLHVQLARAYTGLGQKEKGAALLERSQEIQRAAQERERSGRSADDHAAEIGPATSFSSAADRRFKRRLSSKPR